MSYPSGRPDRRPAPSTPRWVKAIGIILLALVVLAIILQLTGVVGDHGPGRHAAVGGIMPLLGIAARCTVTER